VESIADFTAKLKAKQINYENWAGDRNTVTNRVDGIKQIYFKDPDGHWLEVNDDHK
jgi:lactoylglutathione lyase